ncbi:MAG: glycosyltransferase family 2 protein [Thiobacillus sp.]|nr:glycosyltransferase family 2 protein [Thiobacillus sp.]
MNRLPVSVFIIAKNEADRIPATIESVRDWVDEVIVIDSGSDDDTVQISAALGARVLFRAWTGYGEQKVYGESLCRQAWILNIDADEEISPALREEIIGLFRDGGAPTECVAYRLPVLPLYPFQASGHPWTVTNYPVRLYRKDCAGFSTSTVHDSVIVRAGKIGRLTGMLVHRSYRSLAHHVDKVNFYSSAQAEDLFRKGRNPSGLVLLLTPIFAFFKQFILRREFINGIDGVVVSYMYAFHRFIRVAKARERFRLDRMRDRGE